MTTTASITQAFVAALASEAGIPASELIQSIKGGNPELQGTWVHPYVAVHLAQWLSPRFAVLVSKWVYHWSKEIRHAAGSLNRLAQKWLAKGRDEEWVRERIYTVLTRRELTNEWRDRDLRHPIHYAILTSLLQSLSLGMKPKAHKEHKGLEGRQSLRNNSTEIELLLTRLGQRATIEIARAIDARGFRQNKLAVERGGTIAKNARLELEAQIGAAVVSADNFLPKPARALAGPR